MNEKLANPAPLGLMGFGMTTVLLNIHNAGFMPISAMILAMGLAYGGLASIVSDTLVDAGVSLQAFRRLGVPQVYAGFGSADELRDKHGFGLAATIEAARNLV